MSMGLYKHCSNRFSDYVSVSIPCEDGVNVFLAGTRFMEYLRIGQIDIRNNTSEVMQTTLFEKRKHPQASTSPTLIGSPINHS